MPLGQVPPIGVRLSEKDFVKRVGKVLTGGRSNRLNKIFLIYWEYIETGGKVD